MKEYIMKKHNKMMMLMGAIIFSSLCYSDADTLSDLGTNAAPGEIPKWDGSQWRAAHDNVTTVIAGPGLAVGIMTNNQVNVSVAFGGSPTNNLVAAYTDMDATRPPVGAIVAWAKNLTGVSTNLPTGWVECDGQVLADTNSLLYGQVIPNLNGASGAPQRFLRGAPTSGATGGADTSSLGGGYYDTVSGGGLFGAEVRLFQTITASASFQVITKSSGSCV